MAVAEVRLTDALAPEQQDQYHRDGFVKVPAVFSAEEIVELRAEADLLLQRTERLARDSRIVGAVSALYGEQACLFKDKLIFKPPNAAGYGLHQDYISWDSFPETFVTVIVAIDRADAPNGATEVFPGYHKLGCMSPRDGMYHELTAAQVDVTKGVVLDLDPGDIAILSGFTPHRSAPNRSQQWRRLAYLSYNALSDGGDQRERHYEEFKVWLMGALRRVR